jgi:hypothetical protein
VEVLPGALAVISLNTMYFYDSNKGKYYRYPENSLSTVNCKPYEVANMGTLTTPAIWNLTGWKFNSARSVLAI